MSTGAVGDIVPGDAERERWPLWQPPPPADATAEVENLRAMLAQLSAVLPLAGPLTAWTANKDRPFARREAAKAFNGQVTMLVMMLVVLAPLYPVYLAMDPWFNFPSFHAIPVAEGIVLALGAVQALCGAMSARAGRDWVSPLQRVFSVRLLPEGDPDPRRQLPHHHSGQDGLPR